MTASDWDAEDLAIGSTGFPISCCKAGFNSQYMPFSEWNEHTLEELQKAIQQALEQGDLFDNEQMREMTERLQESHPPSRCQKLAR